MGRTCQGKLSIGDALGSSATMGRKWGCEQLKAPKAVAIILRLIDRGKITATDAALAANPPET